MNSKSRVLAALDFEPHDRVPTYESFWPEFVAQWRLDKGLGPDTDIGDYYATDLEITIPDETPFPSQAGILDIGPGFEIRRNGWGMVQRLDLDAKFYREQSVAVPSPQDAAGLEFESPRLEERFAPVADVEQIAQKRCVFVKTGGPYLRTANLRGAKQWLIDLASSPGFAADLAMKVTRHMTAVGLEAIRRYNLYDTGIWFFDDMGSNLGPMFSPRVFKRVFLPCYRWMCEQYRQAGVKHILLHCDGNIEPILDDLVSAGIMGFHPVEPKAGMDIVGLRRRYGRHLAFLGGLDNAHILTSAPLSHLKEHVMRVLSVAMDSSTGGLVIGAHSIGPDVSVERYDFVHELIRENGVF